MEQFTEAEVLQVQQAKHVNLPRGISFDDE